MPTETDHNFILRLQETISDDDVLETLEDILTGNHHAPLEGVNRWIDALRSDAYTQGYLNLRNNDDTFCCLGVLCDINKGDKWTWEPGETAFTFHVTNTVRESFISLTATINREFLDLDPTVRNLLMELNDSEVISFHDIARLLTFITDRPA